MDQETADSIRIVKDLAELISLGLGIGFVLSFAAQPENRRKVFCNIAGPITGLFLLFAASLPFELRSQRQVGNQPVDARQENDNAGRKIDDSPSGDMESKNIHDWGTSPKLGDWGTPGNWG